MLVEPIGSCIDLAATVIRPLADRLAQPCRVAPYVVLIKPRHALRILENRPQAGVTPAAVYIFRKQLEEADLLAINRVDEMSADEVNRLTLLLSEQYPDRTVLTVSAKTGDGFGAMQQALEQFDERGQHVLEVDGDQYSAGEAALGWLNARLVLTGQTQFSLDSIVFGLLHQMQNSLATIDAQIAHIKVIGVQDGRTSAANLIGSEFAPEFSMQSHCLTRQADIAINARVGITPSQLSQCVRAAIDNTCVEHKVTAIIRQMQSFRPGAPAPPMVAIKSLG